MPAQLINEFVVEKQDWIHKKRLEWQALPKPMVPCFKEGGLHYFLGEPHRISLSSSKDDEPIIELTVRVNTEKNIESALERWYRDQALAVFSERHRFWLEQLHAFKFPESNITLRKMKRRWGSCSRKGLITLNTHLVRYPLNCIDAVIVHELCHLHEFNHSKRFYRLLDQAYPAWRHADQMLKQLSYQY